MLWYGVNPDNHKDRVGGWATYWEARTECVKYVNTKYIPMQIR